ncbi:hypothetical protein [Muriicola marianensis]|uniref:Uncharacterized protein n=1 Tax=Muriicola marianensis TaxID=1324801 RepID=A0ABQ1QUF7_9FLAO|nr:hypothetical protein [Muriicola marianensis]GGD42800.1 hypothetical protein GCM10011361_07220 [Muriicola marianensis]
MSRRLFQIGSYLRFLIRSTNQHGVHSPFLFAYLTKCLYKKLKGPHSRTEKIALKSIPYFNYQSVYVEGKKEELEGLLKKEFGNLSFGRPPYDLVCIDREILSDTILDRILPLCHNSSMILIEGIHKSRKDLGLWELLCDDPRVTVSVDYFFGGILFLREEQAKQHFRIRI